MQKSESGFARQQRATGSHSLWCSVQLVEVVFEAGLEERTWRLVDGQVVK